tara:strand:+ start:532 stop:927 length:396 start_codon:yes stop_codon:yes gene_type:complete
MVRRVDRTHKIVYAKNILDNFAAKGREMINKTMAIAAALSLAGCNTINSLGIERPPEQYQGPALVEVQFLPTAEVNRQCVEVVGRHMLAGYWLGCAYIEGRIFMPDPCEYNGYYAQLLCHELGHAQGMPAE